MLPDYAIVVQPGMGLVGVPGVEDAVEYEARINHIWPKTNNVYVCVHDAK
jgi:hypothetical protein